MKYFAIFCTFFFYPFSSVASTLLANCDDKPYDVIVRNGGSERMVTLTRKNGEIEEFGPMVSFQIKDATRKQPIVSSTTPDEEFCIWGGRIEVQRLNTSAGFGEGGWR